MSHNQWLLIVVVWVATVLCCLWMGRRAKPLVPMITEDASAGDKLARHLAYWKMAYLQVLLLTGVSFGTFYLAQTDGFTGERWAATSAFEKNRIYLFCLINAASVITAFLNKTMARLDPDQFKADRQLSEAVASSEAEGERPTFNVQRPTSNEIGK